jgi:hypothetical protein
MIIQKNIIDLQPSQLFISEDKLFGINSWLPEQINSYDPIPVKLLDNRLVITDGHTRLYALLLMGYQNVRVEWDEDDLDWNAYRICVKWCLESGIKSVENLVGRILDKKSYKKLWLDRCSQLHSQLLK